MRKSYTSIVLFISLIFLIAACEDDTSVTENTDSNTWLLYERGYSPGAGYIIEEIPAEPAQTITFNADGTITTTVNAFNGYQAWTLTDGVLTLTKTDKSMPALTPLNYTYKEEGDFLRLEFRFCIEGCHLGFKRVR